MFFSSAPPAYHGVVLPFNLNERFLALPIMMMHHHILGEVD